MSDYECSAVFCDVAFWVDFAGERESCKLSWDDEFCPSFSLAYFAVFGTGDNRGWKSAFALYFWRIVF